ncbi:MAG: hypothetical protein JSV18_03595, partial [Candidatus Bathyarchaeota archaeon]
MSGDFEGLLGDAAALGREYRWIEAADAYELALRLVETGDFFSRGEVQEKIGHSLHKAAFQAGSREEFLERLRLAMEAYQKTHGFYEKLEDEKRIAWMLRCSAVSRYLEHWAASDPSEKRRLLDECLELEEEALNSFWDQGEKLEYGRTYNEFSFALSIRVIREWDREAWRDATVKGVSWGKKAVEALSELDDPHEIARAHLAYAYNLGRNTFFFEPKPEKQQQN